MRVYKVTYTTVGRGTAFIVAEDWAGAEAHAKRLGPVISIEMLEMDRHDQGERWAEALRGGRYQTEGLWHFRDLVHDAAEAQERFGDDELERYAQDMHDEAAARGFEKPDIAAVEDALDYADMTEAEMRLASGDR